MPMEAQEVAIIVFVIAALCMVVNVFDVFSVASPGTLIGFGLGGVIGVAGFAFGPEGGFLGMGIGLLLGGFIGSGIYKFGETLSYHVGRAYEERLMAAIGQQMNRMLGKSDDKNQ